MSEEPVVLLSSNKKEREAYENYAGLHTYCTSTCVERCCLTLPAHADLFAIFKTTEKLERAYVRDAISSKDYEPACQKLIGQYKTLWDSLKDTVRRVSACCSLCPARQEN